LLKIVFYFFALRCHFYRVGRHSPTSPQGSLLHLYLFFTHIGFISILSTYLSLLRHSFPSLSFYIHFHNQIHCLRVTSPHNVTESSLLILSNFFYNLCHSYTFLNEINSYSFFSSDSTLTFKSPLLTPSVMFYCSLPNIPIHTTLSCHQTMSLSCGILLFFQQQF